jgi:hypothetical protein
MTLEIQVLGQAQKCDWIKKLTSSSSVDYISPNSVTCDRSVVFSTNKTGHHDITEILLKGV